MKRLLSLLTAAVVLLSALPALQLPVYAGLADIPQKERNLTDEEFLGLWDGEAWTVPPRINYSYDAALAPVEEAVKEGRHDEAAVLLWNYYKETGRRFRFPSDRRSDKNTSTISLFCDNIFVRGSMQSQQTIGQEAGWYGFDMTEPIKAKLSSGVKLASYTFMSRYKSDQTAVFSSREAGEEFAPVLVVTVDGEERPYPATADTYIRGGANANESYGSEAELRVHESGMPVDDDTMRMYLQFDFPDLSAASRIQSAELRVYGGADGPEPMSLIAFNSEQLEIREDAQTWMTTGINFYSWQGSGKQGPSEWIVPLGSGYDYMSPLERFWTPMAVVGLYEASGDEFYAEKLIDYTTNFYENHGGGGLLLPPKLRASDTNLAAGSRLQMVTDMYWTLINSPSFDEKDNLVFLKLIYDDVTFLNMPECFWGHHAAGNNWGSAGNAGLSCALGYFPEFDNNEAWLEELAKRVSHQLDTLILDDGAYVETTNSYPTTVFADFVKYKAIMTDIGYPIPSALDAKMKRFLYAFMNSIEPNGNLTEYGDDSYDYAQDFLDQIYEMGESYGDEYLKFIATGGEEGEAPAHTSVDYPNGKYTIMRTGWNKNDLFSFLITKPFGTHSHNHGMSMTLYAYGRRLLADTSQRSYDNETISNWQRLRRVSHNVIEMDDSTIYTGWTDNTGYIKGNSWNTTAPAYDLFDGFHRENDPAGGGDFAEMKRRVTFIKPLGYWIVSDYAETEKADIDVHKYNQAWHMEARANVRMNQTTKKFYSNYDTGANLEIVPADPGLIEGTVATDGYMGTSNHRYASYVKYSEGPVTYDTLLLPTQAQSSASGQVSRIEMDVPTTTASAMTVTVLQDGRTENSADYYTSYEENPQLRTFGVNLTDAKTAFLNTNTAGEYTFALLNDGTKLSSRGRDLIAAGSVIHDLSVQWEGATLALTTSAERAEELGTIRIYAPDQTAVTLNGSSVSFGRDGAYVILNPPASRLASSGAFSRFETHVTVTDGTAEREAVLTNPVEGNEYTAPGAMPRTFAAERKQENLAKTAQITLPSNQQDAGLLADGKLATMWTAADGDYPQTIELDLGAVRDLSDVSAIWTEHDTGLGRFTYQWSASLDGRSFDKLPVRQGGGVTSEQMNRKARYLRLAVTDNSFFCPVSLREIEVHSPGEYRTDSEWKAAFSVGEPGGAVQSPIRLAFSGLADKQAALAGADGSLAEITARLTADSAEGLGAADTALMESGDDLILWTRKTGDFVLYGSAERETVPNPDEGGGRPSRPDSSGGGGGGGGGGGPVVIPPVTPTPTPPQREENPFGDLEGHWAKEEVLRMVSQGIVKGVTEDSFEPDRSITRAEFTALAARAFDLGTAEYQGSFADVPSGAWYAGELQAACDGALVSGSDGLFRPDDEITREEAAKILVAAAEAAGGGTDAGGAEFADSGEISAWAREAVAKAAGLGIVKGDEAGNVRPKAPATRAEAVVMIARALPVD